MTKTIIRDEVLFTSELKLDGKTDILKLCKQSYSDNTHFYTIQDNYGTWRIHHASSDINELIEALNTDIESDNKMFSNFENEKIAFIRSEINTWRQKILDFMYLIK